MYFDKWLSLQVSLIWILVSSHSTSARIGMFWHLTDVHMDGNYSTEGDPTNMCWSVGTSSGSSENPSEFGNYNCDAPKELVTSAIQAMKEIHSDPDFILWTGDDTAHVNDSFFSNDIVLDVISEISGIINDVFPLTMVLPVLGNHDLYPQNQAPVGLNQFQTDVANLWQHWLTEYDGYEEFNENGRYTADIPNSNVTFLGLNTLIWYQFNDITNNDTTAIDPSNQFQWARDTIGNLTARGRKVYLMGHIPPGSFERYFDDREGFHWYQDRYNEQYINLVKDYKDHIVAQFFGHHHTDSYRVFLDNDEAISYLLIAPAVSPMRSTLSEATGANNPGIRLIAYDTESGEIQEVSQYYNNLTHTIETGQYNWVLEYKLKDLLELSTISPSSLYNAALKMKDDRTYFDKYYQMNTVLWENISACSEECRITQFCSITEVDYSSFYECSGCWSSYISWAGYTLVLVVFMNIAFQFRF